MGLLTYLSTDSIWMEIAVVSIVYALGNIFFGHFEERSPKFRKAIKYILTLIIIITLSIFFGRTIAFSVLGFMFIPFFFIHFYQLPKKNGINGLTGEPKEKYYELRGWDKDIFKKKNDIKKP